MSDCCTPGRRHETGSDSPLNPSPALKPAAVEAGKFVAPSDLVRIDACSFLMGNDGPDAVAGDGEGPVRSVSMSSFSIAATTVTNRQFGEFVRATHYVTEAERNGNSFVFYLQLSQGLRRQARLFATGMPWWLPVSDACWQRPEGAGSHVRDRLDHPVVHVSWHDARAYCDWVGARLPTEAQWECAARGGLNQQTFPWGNELNRDGEPRCNVWRGHFPNDPAAGWSPGPVPARSNEPNAFGLYNLSGNVWEWCADWYSTLYHRATEPGDPCFDQPTGRRSLRGGSFLCHPSYCNRYRVAARFSNDPHSTASNIGFRVAKD